MNASDTLAEREIIRSQARSSPLRPQTRAEYDAKVTSSAQAPSSPRSRPRIVLSDLRVAIITGMLFLLAALLAAGSFSWLAQKTGQVDGRVAQVSQLFAAAMGGLWLSSLVTLLWRRR